MWQYCYLEPTELGKNVSTSVLQTKKNLSEASCNNAQTMCTLQTATTLATRLCIPRINEQCKNKGKKNLKLHKFYLFEFFDKPGSFNTTLHIKADVHFDLGEGVSQFDDGNLGTHMIQVLILSGDSPTGDNRALSSSAS